MTIQRADLAASDVQALIAYHQQAMRDGSPPGQSFALDLSGLQANGVITWEARTEGKLAAIGAFKPLDRTRGEVKSMRTHPNFLRQGFAAALLETIISHARAEGFTLLSLETGCGPQFEPALALYRRRGFLNGQAFANYVLTDFNQCLHLTLD